MMRKFLFLLTTTVVLFTSCKDKEEDPDPGITNNLGVAADFAPLKVGNYWIYQNYLVAPDGNVLNDLGTDSIYVSGDTIVEGKTYFKVMNFSPVGSVPTLMSTEGDELIGPNGAMYLHTSKLNDTLATYEDQYYASYTIVRRSDQDVTVPAGTFSDLIDFQRNIYQKPPLPNQYNPRIWHNYYAKTIGMVKEVYFYASSPNVVERRLVRYQLN